MSKARPPEKWEHGAPNLWKVHLWPNPKTHVLSAATILLAPAFLWDAAGAELMRYWTDNSVRLSDLNLDWSRSPQSWATVISYVTIWFIAIVFFFLTPVHISLDKTFIRWTSTAGIERGVLIDDIAQVVFAKARSTEFVHIKFRKRKMPLSISLSWSGAQGWLNALQRERPDVFPARSSLATPPKSRGNQ